MTDCETGARKRYLIGVPFVLLILLALPLMVVLAPAIFVACLAVQVNPFAAFHALWGVVTALRGAHVEVADGDHTVLVHVS